MSEVAAIYERRRADFRRRREEEDSRSNRVGVLRLITFLVGSGALIIRTFVPSSPQTVLAAGALACAGVFVALLAIHRGIRHRVRRLGALEELNGEGLRRLRRDWRSLPDPKPTPVPEDHPYATDLDVTGHASLLHLLGTVATEAGRATLAGWLLEPSPAPEIRARQAGVAELAPKVEFRDAFAAEGRLLDPESPEALEAFLTWAEEEPWLLNRTGQLVAAIVLPLLTLPLLVLYFTQVGWAPWWLFPMIAQALLVRTTSARIHMDFDRATSGEAGVSQYAPLLERIETEALESSLLQDLGGRLERGKDGAHAHIVTLVRRLGWAEARRSMLHPVLNHLLHWDLHVQRSLERWKARWGHRIRDWVSALGEMDALATLATLRHDHPEWCLPELWTEPRVEGEGLGHPLLAPALCVPNDVEVGPPDSFLLVTGSNMSGKSTLLRALGCNVVLAQAGGPVCATRFRLPSVRLWTSMRVDESLEDGISFFMAELRRLGAVVDAARAVSGDPDELVLFLLDEILQGTNTAERQIAARTVLRHLLGEGAIGAVTTHDLTLAAAEDLRARAEAVHFTESVDGDGEGEGPALHFDYRLQPGIATSTNALKLMEMVGLGDGHVGRPPRG